MSESSTSGATPSISGQPDSIGDSQPKGASTGPRTPDGKRRSARNASKHNFLVGRVLPEEEQYAAFLRENFLEDLKAQSLLEEELVDDLVLNRVQRLRLDKYVVNEFDKATKRKLDGWLEMIEQRDAEIWVRHPLARRETESTGRERLNPKDCVTILDGLRTRIRERGLSLDEDMDLLRSVYGERSTSHGALIYHIYKISKLEWNGREERDETRTAEHAERQTQILKLLDTEIELQQGRAKLQADLDDREIPLHGRVLPQPDILDSVQRYQAANAREFTHLLDAIERVRRVQKHG